MWKLDGIFLLLILSVTSAFGVNILYLAAMPSPSHHIWNRALAFGLVSKGHNVTHIGPDEDTLPKPQNYTHILLEGVYGDMDDSYDVNDMANYGPAKMLDAFQSWCLTQCKSSLQTEGLKTLLKYPKNFKFDLIVIDITCGTCLHPLIHRLNYPPTVAVTPFPLPVYISYGFGNELFPSYIPWYALPYTTEMNFVERIWNFLFTYLDIFSKYFKHWKDECEAAKEVFGDDVPSMMEIQRHISLVLANTDPILDQPQPLPPNIIPVGGLHTRKSKEIPREFLNILNSAQNGVILFSLGTNIRADKLGEKTITAIINALRTIPQTIIWKFESNIDNLPKNVIIKKWLPQNDILGHPKVKLFIGHGGTLSTQEAFFHGVPMVAIPFIVDQYINSRNIENKKLGVYVDIKQITTEYFLSKLKEALNNPIYAENVKKISRRYNDRKETALERGIFWIEYTLRHGGANFLSVAGRDLPFYKSSSLDVISFLCLISIIVVVTLYKLVKLVFKLFNNSKKKVKAQ